MLRGRQQTDGANGHQHIRCGGYYHSVRYLARSRRLFAAFVQCTENSHTNRREGHYIERVELLEDRSSDAQFGRMVEVLEDEEGGDDRADATPYDLGFAGVLTEDTEERIDEYGNSYQVPDAEGHGLCAGHNRVDKLIGEEGKRETVLMEGHPEEEDYREDQAERHNAFLGLLRRQFLHFLITALRHLFGGVLHMLEPGTASVVDSYTDDERSASHHEGEVITVVDIVAQTVLCPGHDLDRSGRREHGTDVDCHVEEREGSVTAVSVLGIVVQIADHDLQVAFEQTRTERDEKQCQEHDSHRKTAATQGYSQADVAEEHDEDTDGDALAVTDFVSNPTAYQRQKIHTCQKSGVDTTGSIGRQSEISAQEERKDG